MHTFVINLQRNPERRAFMTKQLDTLDLPHTIIDATDGAALKDEEIATLYDQEKSLTYIKTPLRTNEIACAHSHKRVYETIAAQDLPYALVLEDDVTLDAALPDFLVHASKHADHFDWLQLDYPPVGWPFFKNWLRGSLVYTKQNPLFFIYALLKLPYISVLCLFESLRQRVYQRHPRMSLFARPLYYASAYFVTNVGAKKLLSISDRVLFAADMLPNKARILAKLKMRASVPPLARQEKQRFASDIGQSH